jgi:hypothetical protein
MYEIAESAFPPEQQVTPTWELMSKYSAERDGQFHFPFDAFWIPDSEFTRILKEAQKNLRGWWRCPDRGERFIQWMDAKTEVDEKADSGEITRAEARKELKMLAKEFGCHWYSRDKSEISFFLCLGSPTPTSNRETMLEIRDIYSRFMELVEGGSSPEEAADKAVDKKPDIAKRRRQTILDMWTFWSNYSTNTNNNGQHV